MGDVSPTEQAMDGGATATTWEWRKFSPGHGNTQKNMNGIPSGKLSHNYGKPQFLMGIHQLFLWQFSIATLNYQRVCQQHSDFLALSENGLFFFSSKNVAIFSWDNLMPIRWSFCWGTHFSGANMKEKWWLFGEFKTGFLNQFFFELIKSWP